MLQDPAGPVQPSDGQPAQERPKQAKPNIDWAAIEADYAAGAESIRSLGRKYGISERAIRYHAKRHAWVRRSADRLGIIRERLSQAGSQGIPRASPAEIAERLTEEAQLDASDLGCGLRVARTVLRRLEAMAESAETPQELRVVAQAADSAVATIARIRALAEPADHVITIERAWSPAETPGPADHAPDLT
jgi:hypothetical protein